MARPIDDLLDDYRAVEGPRIVQGSELRALVAEVDRLRADRATWRELSSSNGTEES